jgi:two-component sensor histidine kinase
VALEIDADNISLGVDLAIPCGLIITELVSNSLKHAFPKNRKGKIKITLRRVDEKMCELIVSDNGVSIPENIDFRKTNTLGFITMLSYEGKGPWGKFKLSRDGGTEFRVKFEG